SAYALDIANVSRHIPPRAAVTTIMPAVGGPSSTVRHSSGVKASRVVIDAPPRQARLRTPPGGSIIRGERYPVRTVRRSGAAAVPRASRGPRGRARSPPAAALLHARAPPSGGTPTGAREGRPQPSCRGARRPGTSPSPP